MEPWRQRRAAQSGERHRRTPTRYHAAVQTRRRAVAPAGGRQAREWRWRTGAARDAATATDGALPVVVWAERGWRGRIVAPWRATAAERSRAERSGERKEMARRERERAREQESEREGGERGRDESDGQRRRGRRKCGEAAASRCDSKITREARPALIGTVESRARGLLCSLLCSVCHRPSPSAVGPAGEKSPLVLRPELSPPVRPRLAPWRTSSMRPEPA